MFPGDEGYPSGHGFYGARWGQVAPRLGVIWSPLDDNSMSVRAAYGLFYDTPHLFFGTRFSNSPPWGAQISLTNPAGGLEDPWAGYPGGNPFPGLRTDWADSDFPFYGVYVSAPLNLYNTRLQQWNFSVQKGFGDYLLAASYLGNRGTHGWRAIEANPAVYAPGASTRNTNQRRVLYEANPDQGQDLLDAGDHLGRRADVVQRPAALRAEAHVRQLERADELHAVQVPVRPADHRDHRSDDDEPGEPGFSTTGTAVRTGATAGTCPWWPACRPTPTASSAPSSATGRLRRSSG